MVIVKLTCRRDKGQEMIGTEASCKLFRNLPKVLILRSRCFLLLNLSSKQIIPRAYHTTTAIKPEQRLTSDCKFLLRRNDSDTFKNTAVIYHLNVRMSKLGRLGKVDAARKLFDEMPDRDPVSYASMISIYLKHNEFPKAEKLFSEIPQGMKGVVVDSAMVHAYAKAGQLDKARTVFDKMPERNAFSWTSLISGYLNLSKVDDALELFDKMPNKIKNEFTWTNMISGLARNGLIDKARDTFDHMPSKNVVAWTSMINAYVENGHVDEALNLFRIMPQRNLYSWNIMIRGLLDDSRVDEAKELFDSMPWSNAISWTTMVTGLAQNRMIEFARKYFDQMPHKDVSAWNAMITAYIADGCIIEAGQLFKLMPSRNVVTWNAMIDGYAKYQQEDEAFRLFVLMLHSCVRPNETSFTSLLTSCNGILGVLQVHGLVERLGFGVETSLVNTLITMYYKNGDLNSARIAFDCLEAKDVVTWTSMILAYSYHGFGMLALQAFARMLRTGHIPDEITFVGVLSACSHAGLVKKGKMLFDTIKRAYGFEPMAEHYTCLVDILGRAGLVTEAMKVIHTMPSDKYDATILGALLGSCRLHGDDGLADCLGDELIALEPANSGGYVLLANLYAASGKWDKFSHLRKKMKEKDVKKVPGYSLIEINGKNHVFLVGDRSHPAMKEIYNLIQENLLPLMQDMGYRFSDMTLLL